MADTTLNTKPIFSATPHVGGAVLSTANTAHDGTGSEGNSIKEVFFPGASKAGYVSQVRVSPRGDVSTATVVRLFINNGGDIATEENNHLIKEIQVPVIATDEEVAIDEITWEPEYGQIPSGYKVYATISQANTDGIEVTCIGGRYTE